MVCLSKTEVTGLKDVLKETRKSGENWEWKASVQLISCCVEVDDIHCSGKCGAWRS